MGITVSGSTTAENNVPSGIQVEFRVADAEFNFDGPYGPNIQLELELADEQYLGTTCRYYASVQQPRLDLVRKYRSDGMSDKLIADALRERGFKFTKIDQKDEMQVGRFGNLYKILSAVLGSDTGAEKALGESDDFMELASRFVGGRFIGTTKLTADGAYVRLDGREEIFPVVGGDPETAAAVKKETEEDFANLSF